MQIPFLPNVLGLFTSNSGGGSEQSDMGAQISNRIAAVENEITKKGTSPAKCAEMISQLKIALTELPGLQPSAPLTDGTLSDIQHAQNVYELATLLSVRQEDEEGFERHVSRVKTYYVDYAGVLPASPRQNLILGLNLMRLLAQNRIGEFHTELELVPAAARSDAYINYALTLEQYLMEGSYSRIASARATAPDASFNFFLDILMFSMRVKIAQCSEKAYESISVDAAGKLLSITDKTELHTFCEERGWRMVGDTIFFAPDLDGVPTMEQVPSADLIKRSLDYARELEQII